MRFKRHLFGSEDALTRSFAIVIIVPSLKIAIMRIMNGGKSYSKMKASSAKERMIRIVIEQV